MKICIVSGCDPLQEEFGVFNFENIKNYAKRHGYDYKIYQGDNFYFTPHAGYFEDRAFNWVKVALVAKNLQYFDYVLWIDADAFIVRHDLKLEDAFKLSEGNFEFWLAPDTESPNVGVFLVKNTPFMISFFEEWTSRGYEKNNWILETMASRKPNNLYEQGAWWDMYNHNWHNIMPYVRFLKPQEINAHLQSEYWRAPFQPYMQYIPESFILHLAGLPNNKRIECYNTIIKPLIGG